MNTQTVSCDDVDLPRAALHHPFNPLVQIWHAIATRWAAHLEAERKAHEFDFVADLNANTLRDIGAPEHLIDEATERQEFRSLSALELRPWRDG